MSSPRERSEARRKALLDRGTDRLKKLTSSARGEDAPQFAHEDPPLVVPLKSFIGESTPAVSTSTETLDPEWSPEAIRRSMQSFISTDTDPDTHPHVPSLYTETQTKTPSSPQELKKKSQRVTLLLSVLCPTLLLVYYSVFYEPSLYRSYSHIGNAHWTYRWSSLGLQAGYADRTDGVQPVPFLVSFIACLFVQQLSSVLLLPVESVQPALYTMVSPYLPSSIRRRASQFLLFVRLLSSMLDQMAVVVFGIGTIVWIAGTGV